MSDRGGTAGQAKVDAEGRPYKVGQAKNADTGMAVEAADGNGTAALAGGSDLMVVLAGGAFLLRRRA